MHDEQLIGILLDEACLTLDQLAAACAAPPEWVVEHIEEGLIAPFAGTAAEWRFSTAALRRARRIRALERDFDAVPELAALTADLIEEVEILRARLARAGLD